MRDKIIFKIFILINDSFKSIMFRLLLGYSISTHLI